jgi:hypothetical protein
VESPVSRLTIEIIERIFLFAHWQCVCLEGSGKDGMIPGSPQASLDGFQASTYFAGARHDFVFKTGCHGVGYYLDLAARCTLAAVSQSFEMHGYGILHTHNAAIAGAWSRGFQHGHSVCRKASLEDGEIRLGVGYCLFDQGQLVHEACEAFDGTCTFDNEP